MRVGRQADREGLLLSVEEPPDLNKRKRSKAQMNGRRFHAQSDMHTIVNPQLFDVRRERFGEVQKRGVL